MVIMAEYIYRVFLSHQMFPGWCFEGIPLFDYIFLKREEKPSND